MDEVAANTPLYALIGEAKALILGFAIAAARMIGLVSISPILRRAELGRVLAGVLAVGLALPVAASLGPAVEAATAARGTGLGLALLMGKEVLLGLFLGLLFAIPFWAVGAVGDLIDHQRSIGDSGHQDPVTRGNASIMSGLLTLTVIALFVTEGGLRVMVSTVYASYAVWPLDGFAPRFDRAALDALYALLGRVVRLAVVVAGPLVALFLVSDFALAGLSRMGGRIQLVSTLPLVKNLLFAALIVAYLQHAVGPMTEGLADAREVLAILALFAPAPP